jgi:hypothetical protein
VLHSRLETLSERISLLKSRRQKLLLKRNYSDVKSPYFKKVYLSKRIFDVKMDVAHAEQHLLKISFQLLLSYFAFLIFIIFMYLENYEVLVLRDEMLLFSSVFFVMSFSIFMLFPIITYRGYTDNHGHFKKLDYDLIIDVKLSHNPMLTTILHSLKSNFEVYQWNVKALFNRSCFSLKRLIEVFSVSLITFIAQFIIVSIGLIVLPIFIVMKMIISPFKDVFNTGTLFSNMSKETPYNENIIKI